MKAKELLSFSPSLYLTRQRQIRNSGGEKCQHRTGRQEGRKTGDEKEAEKALARFHLG